MRKAFHLSTCSTCKRILKEIKLDPSFTLQDIKANKISGEDLDIMKDMAGSFEALFSRKAMKYRSMGLNTKKLDETDYRELILEEYTFLKRPVFVFDDKIFIGNTSKTVDELKAYLN